jgi:creatinase
MVVSMEPMITGYREHDILVVHDDGAENITGFPSGPDHNIIPC